LEFGGSPPLSAVLDTVVRDGEPEGLVVRPFGWSRSRPGKSGAKAPRSKAAASRLRPTGCLQAMP